jgi:hypothetical protein
VSANSVQRPGAGASLNLDAIEASLQNLQARFPEINKLLRARRDSLDRNTVANMMAGYRFVDRLLARQVDLLAMGNLKLFLEMNALVLFGSDESMRAEAAVQLAATEQRFYDQADSSIRDVIEWYDLHRANSAWRRAAGVYISIVANLSCSSRAITALAHWS